MKEIIEYNYFYFYFMNLIVVCFVRSSTTSKVSSHNDFSLTEWTSGFPIKVEYITDSSRTVILYLKRSY